MYILTASSVIEPWTVTIQASKESATGSLNLGLKATEKLDVNISTTFVELALTTLDSWNTEGVNALQRPRGGFAPYRIKNSTGTPLFIWSDTENSNQSDEEMVKITNGQTVDWRFGDWKTMREVNNVKTRIDSQAHPIYSIYHLANTLSEYSL